MYEFIKLVFSVGEIYNLEMLYSKVYKQILDEKTPLLVLVIIFKIYQDYSKQILLFSLLLKYHEDFHYH